ncbi:MAG: sensor histidine kinase, partial [Gammaproteobacteria bacterium]
MAWDITEHQQLVDSLRQADRAKDEFLAMLAHELRNPLAPLTNALKLLERSADRSAPQQQALALAGRQTAQLTRLVDDLLEVSRITRGKIELRCEPMTVAAAVRNAAESVAAAVE